MNAESKKNCPFCAETVSIKARICPHCRRWLTWRSFQHPVTWAVLSLALMFTVFTYLGVKAQRIFSISPPPYYSEFPNALKILQSQMFFKETEYGPRIYITGLLTNQSQMPWRNVEFECRFFDTNDNLVDVGNTQGNFTIQAQDDSAFRLVVTPAKDAKEYSRVELFISNARNEKSWF